MVSSANATPLREKLIAFITKWYVAIIFAMWTFSPLLRRLVDWQFGYHKISIIALLPTLVLMPGLYVLTKKWSKLGRGFRGVFLIWAIAFSYSFLVAFASGSLLPGLFTLVLFLAPAGIAAVLLTASDDPREAYERATNALLVCASIASVYAIYQYIAPPPWDVLWVQAENIVSMGSPVPFGLRVFGPYNSSGPFGLYLVFALVMALPLLRISSWKNTAMIAPIVVALLLTQVRVAWIGLALAAVVYLVLAPGRRAPLAALAMVSAACIAFGIGLISTVHDAQVAVTTIGDRLTTFQSISSDDSVITRQGETSDSWKLGLQDPLGFGLGSMSLGSRLSGGSGGGIDNGYLSRLVELGLFAWLLYLAAMIVALATTLSVYFRVRRRDRGIADIAALGVTLQLLLLFLEGAFDNHNGFSGIFFWLSLYVCSAVVAVVPKRVEPEMTFSRERRVLPPPRLGTT